MELATATDLPSFVRDISFAELPPEVVAQAHRCLRDLIGVAVAGSRTPSAAITNAFATAQMGSPAGERGARLLFDGRRASMAGAAYAGASTIDAFDAHDGHRLTKGHAGVALLPALLAFVDAAAERPEGRELVTCLVLGYEIATRAGLALHATTSDYHCSGAWNSIACAAIGARLLGFDRERVRHAIGIAEYFGPRGQILRVCEVPTMLKDGSGWGALVGVSATLLARDGFTGAPAVTVEGVDAGAHWHDLGSRWTILEQYFKPYPVCHWAQQAITAALALQAKHGFASDAIERVTIETFAEAVALGSGCALPTTTEEAQYSLPFPVAAALVFGRVGADEIGAAGLSDARVHRLLSRMTLVEDAAFSKRFPSERWARVRIALADGRTLVSEPAQVRGVPDNPLTDEELRSKYREFAGPLGNVRRARIESLVDTLTTDRNSIAALIDEILSPAVSAGTQRSVRR